MPPRPRPVVLCILDGWGERKAAADNAITQAKTPVWHRLMARWPHAHLQASEHYVGLPDGQMGNSEVGHTNLGAGRVVMQDLPRIDDAIATGKIAEMPALDDFIAKVKAKNGAAHVFGLMSPGGVHSHQRQIAALCRILAKAGLKVAVHAALDGRDTPPQSALGYLKQFKADTGGVGDIRIATVSGRYYAMDRDKRWDRVEKAYAMLTQAAGRKAADPIAAVETAYAQGETDEFVLPTAIGDYAGMQSGDGLLLANFRADRIREIAAALLDPGFSGFARDKLIDFSGALGLVEYSEELNPFLATLFPPDDLERHVRRDRRARRDDPAAHRRNREIRARHLLLQWRTRDRVPRRGAHPGALAQGRDLRQAAANVGARGDRQGGRRRFNPENSTSSCSITPIPTWSGIPGIEAAAEHAVEAVDACLGRLAQAVEAAGGVLVITADHGNAEMMRDPETGAPHTAHTLNPVPLIVVNAPPSIRQVQNGRLADVAPTLLALLALPRPSAMTGHSLLGAAEAQRRAAG